jgi:hypothetical protein
MSEEIFLNAKIDKKLHKKLRIKLLKNDLTYRDWLENKVKEYVENN